MTTDGIKRSAEFSQCRTWRYTLERYWSEGPYALFILLNPSTADEHQDDPTNRRGIGFAKRWGYHGCVFVNLFAVRTPDPKVMKQDSDPIGPLNDSWIDRMCRDAGVIVAAWGTHGDHLGRNKDVMCLIQRFDVQCLGLTKHGHPKHILYLPSDTVLQPFDCGAGE